MRITGRNGGPVAAAYALQTARYVAPDLRASTTNATCPATVIEIVAALDADGAALIGGAAEPMRLSARGFHCTLRVAQTLRDLAGEATVRHDLLVAGSPEEAQRAL